MRPARPNEVPRFGSVWRWNGVAISDESRFVAVGLLDEPDETMVMLVAVSISKGIITGRTMPFELRSGMAWGFRNSQGELVVTPGWECVDEGRPT